MIKEDSFILLWLEGLSINNVFDSSKEAAFKDLDLRIDAGEYAVISGVYGTDKISLINVLGCISRPSSGKYIFDYNDTAAIDAEQLDDIRSKHIGFLFKGLNIIDDISVYKNIELPLMRFNSDNQEKIVSIANRLCLSDLLNKKARELTDLERHKVALARALAINPILILADEPGDGLGKKDQEVILDILSDINKSGTAVIAFSDKQEVVEMAARHIVFEKGKVTGDRLIKQNDEKEGAV